jgi:hypothetical protein
MCFYQADCNGFVNKNFMKDIKVSCTKQYLSVSPPLGSPKKESYKYCTVVRSYVDFSVEYNKGMFFLLFF